MLTVIVAGRNDDYGKDFRQRLFRTALHNSTLFEQAGMEFEYLLAEWNPLPDRPALSEEFVDRIPNGRAVIIPPEIHQQYSLNPGMPFHEMPAKNTALRRAQGDVVIVTNADILFSEDLVATIAARRWDADTLYRAHRIDVKPDLDWDQIQDPANQLASGEGRLCPPYYLGAGGDFCLAARSLWHALGGFNERIRFSTRAKDWQFFLNAAAQGIQVEFIGNVYHLDHDGGFRNTRPDERNSTVVHFGRWWDIEFGLPAANRTEWGFSTLREHPLNEDARIQVLESQNYILPEDQHSQDREMMTWLTRPPDSPDIPAAVLLHSICAAHRERRRLICRISDARTAVALSGFDAVASRYGVEIHCNWNWPVLPGYSVRPFAAEPARLRSTDWVVEETDAGIRVHEHATGCDIDVLPATTPVNEPEFNPVLARRLLRAYLQLQEQGTSEIAIYGAGSHTRSLLQWGLPDGIKLVGFLESKAGTVSNPPPPSLTAARYRACASPAPVPLTRGTIDSPPHRGGEPPQAAGGRSHDNVAVLLSSSSFESDMLEACRERGIRNVIALYSDWLSQEVYA